MLSLCFAALFYPAIFTLPAVLLCARSSSEILWFPVEYVAFSLRIHVAPAGPPTQLLHQQALPASDGIEAKRHCEAKGTELRNKWVLAVLWYVWLIRVFYVTVCCVRLTMRCRR